MNVGTRFLPEPLHHFGLYHIPNMGGYLPRIVDDMGRLVQLPKQWFWTTEREGLTCYHEYRIAVEACDAGL